MTTTPLTQDQYVKALTDEGLSLEFIGDWANHNHNDRQPWGPMYGVVIHHIGSDVPAEQSSKYAFDILYTGYTGLAGPICHAGGKPQGGLALVALGNAWHAGGGCPIVLQRVMNEDVPMDAELHPTKGNLTGVNGNPHFYGLEIMFSGEHPMSAEQYRDAILYAAALCRAHVWSARSVIAHREWSSDKPDPGMCPMGTFRQDVQRQLDTRYLSNPAPTPATQEDDMPYTPQDIQTYARQGVLDAQIDTREGGKESVWVAIKEAREQSGDASINAQLAKKSVDALAAQVAALTAAVQALAPKG